MPKPIRKTVITSTDGALFLISAITMDGEPGSELDVAVDEREARFYFEVGITEDFPVADHYAGGLSLHCDSNGLGSSTLIDLKVPSTGARCRIDGAQSAVFPLALPDLCKTDPAGPKTVRVEGLVKTGHFYTAEMTDGCVLPGGSEPERPELYNLLLEIRGSKCDRGPACTPVGAEMANVEIQISD